MASNEELLVNTTARVAALEMQMQALLGERDRFQDELDQMRRIVRGAGAVLTALDTAPTATTEASERELRRICGALAHGDGIDHGALTGN